jgi:hypothetical protein
VQKRHASGSTVPATHSTAGAHEREGSLLQQARETTGERKYAQDSSRTHTTLGKFPYGVPLEIVLRRAAQIPSAPQPMAAINAGAGEGI